MYPVIQLHWVPEMLRNVVAIDGHVKQLLALPPPVQVAHV